MLARYRAKTSRGHVIKFQGSQSTCFPAPADFTLGLQLAAIKNPTRDETDETAKLKARLAVKQPQTAIGGLRITVVGGNLNRS